MNKTYRLIVNPTVEAVEITKETVDWAANWCRGNKLYSSDKPGINVPTLRGVRQAYEGSYLVRTRAMDFIVVESDAFFRKYEPVN